MTNNFSLESADAIAIPVRLLSSVAVVGRDNEPIYLRGDLCDCNAIIASSSSSSSSPTAAASSPKAVTTQHTAADGASSSVITDDEEGNDAKNDDDGEDNDDEGDGASPQSLGRRGGSGNNSGKGLFGRIKGVVGRNNNSSDGKEGADVDEKVEASERQHPEEDTEEDDDDPFGFFENNTNSNNPQSSSSSSNNNDHNHSNIPAVMSLTQQLVLHASLDRFEEMASRSNKGGAVRWRTPGSNSANNAMWMGLLCEVEERWNVYGYLTNTGIKFMILVENIYLNRDGTRLRQDHAPPSLSSSMFGNTSFGNREADLKNMFAQLHELYVRYTLNPFSQLRSPIQSRVFDDGIVRMAQSFNFSPLEEISSALDGGGGYLVGGSKKKKKNGLAWM